MMTTPQQLSTMIKAEAMRLGFSACGIAKAGRVSADEERHLRRWLAKGRYGNMAYMANHLDKRLDPRLLMDGLRSIVSVAMNYAPQRTLPDGEPQIAAYALGHDYHEVMKDRLHRLAAYVAGLTDEAPGQSAEHRAGDDGFRYRVFVDSGPVLERYWACQAGLGWVGRNRQLIIPRAGSMFFLGELFLDIELDYDQPMDSRCGTCHRCIDQCPTQVLNMSGDFDASRCLSYQTIENRGALSEEAKAAMGACFYGCDRCQTACPWNRFAVPNEVPELQPREELLEMTWQKWQQLSLDDYRRLFKGSAVKRAKYEGLMRNIKALEETRSLAPKQGEGPNDGPTQQADVAAKEKP
jgi:epoxyqueuosine reductase